MAAFVMLTRFAPDDGTVPCELAKGRYAGHFDMVMRDLSQTDDLRALDFNGERAFRLFKFSELGGPIIQER